MSKGSTGRMSVNCKSEPVSNLPFKAGLGSGRPGGSPLLLVREGPFTGAASVLFPHSLQTDTLQLN